MTLDIPLHPILIHFPLALLATGALIDLAGLLVGRGWLGKTALLLLVLGALGCVAAVLSGGREEDRIIQTEEIEEVLEEHEEGGKLTMWIFLALAAVRAGLVWRGRFTPPLRWIFLILWAAGLFVMVDTAHHGGQLVYRHGAGISTRPPGSEGRPAIRP